MIHTNQSWQNRRGSSSIELLQCRRLQWSRKEALSFALLSARLTATKTSLRRVLFQTRTAIRVVVLTAVLIQTLLPSRETCWLCQIEMLWSSKNTLMVVLPTTTSLRPIEALFARNETSGLGNNPSRRPDYFAHTSSTSFSQNLIYIIRSRYFGQARTRRRFRRPLFWPPFPPCKSFSEQNEKQRQQRAVATNMGSSELVQYHHGVFSGSRFLPVSRRIC